MQKNNPLHDAKIRGIAFQIALIVSLGFISWLLVSNTLHNLGARNIQTGFGFLERPAGFAIGESAIAYSTASPYASAMLVGFINTLKVSVLAIGFSTLLGVLVGISRLSRNWILARVAGTYVEIVRNIPLLLQLFVWYGTLTLSLPVTREALDLGGGFYLSNRGFFMPAVAEGETVIPHLLALLIGLIVSLGLYRYREGMRTKTGQVPFAVWPLFVIPLLALMTSVVLLGGMPALELPELRGLNFRGGMSISPEFLALTLGLSFYTAGYIGEIVRAGILAVPKGQTEAASALGMKPAAIMLRITLPQAMRTIIPPMTSWHLNTVKNSSLAIVVGYPDLVSVTDTTINQTGQAIEGVAILMAVYLTISLLISALMNWYNARVARFGPAGGNMAAPVPAQYFDLLTFSGIWGWARHNMFSSPLNSAVTLVIMLLLARYIPALVDWTFISSVWSGTAEECRAASGACWAFVAEKYHFILFATYPYEEQWRPITAVGLFAVLAIISLNPGFWHRALFWAWILVIIAMLVLMSGGLLGLTPVPTTLWGGLPVTLILAVLAIVGGVPFGVLLALGRTSNLPIIRAIATTYIEFIRGIPLITVLFMAAIMFPLFLPSSVTVNNLLRVQIGLIFFAAAYIAEVVRGGLQAVPQGQYEAAKALGLGYWQSMRTIILPQALRISVPPMVNTFNSEIKNTTLVLIVGVFDLLHATKTALEDPAWRIFHKEGFIFAALVFFLICFSLSRGSQMLEARLHKRERH